MSPEEAKIKIEDALGGTLHFEGHFDSVFGMLKERRQERLISWVEECRDGKAYPLSSDRIAGLIAFILKFRETNFRAILTKRKNEYFIALFLDKHKYYEDKRKDLGI